MNARSPEDQPRRRNVLLVVVDQWRGDILPALGTKGLRTPNIDALCVEATTFRNHFTQAAPCGPARASLLTGQYQMTHRAVQNTIPLDARFTNLALELRKGGYDPALVGYTTTTPDPRGTTADDPRFFTLGDLMDGFRPVVGAWIVGQSCVGMGLREDRSRITQDLSRFKPHFIRG